MKIIVTKDYEELGKVSAEIVLGIMHQPGIVNIAPTTGTTPDALYRNLIPRIKDKEYFKHVNYYSFDETPYRLSKQEGRIIANLRNMLLIPANIAEEQIHPLTENNYLSRDEELEQLGNLDLVILGLGWDGHFCCNFPGYAKFSQKTVAIPMEGKLLEMYKQVYQDPNEIPDFLVTMGASAIMNAKRLLLMVNGEKKAGILREMLYGEINELVPASILRTHPNITIVVDEAAASKL
ncbi:MAG: glucosamine-6-phosphate deaminase [Coprobacillaceae bacterium]